MSVYTLPPERGAPVGDILRSYLMGRERKRKRELEERGEQREERGLGIKEALAQRQATSGYKPMIRKDPETGKWHTYLTDMRTGEIIKDLGEAPPRMISSSLFGLMPDMFGKGGEGGVSIEGALGGEVPKEESYWDKIKGRFRTTPQSQLLPKPALTPPTGADILGRPKPSVPKKPYVGGEVSDIYARTPKTEIGKAVAEIMKLKLKPEQTQRVVQKLRAGEEIDVKSPDGVAGTVPANKLSEALRQGFTLVFE